MTASTVKSDNITNIEATPIVLLDHKEGVTKTSIDHVAVATTSIDEIGDIILCGIVNSDDVIIDISILNDDLDSNASPLLAQDVGLYYSGIGGTQLRDKNTSGTVISANCIGTAITTLQGANVTPVSVRFEAANITTITQKAWELGGLTSDPGGLFYIGLKATAAAATAAAGDLVVITKTLR